MFFLPDAHAPVQHDQPANPGSYAPDLEQNATASATARIIDVVAYYLSRLRNCRYSYSVKKVLGVTLTLPQSIFQPQNGRF